MLSQPDNIICKHMKKISKIIKRNIEHHQHRLLSTSLHGSNGSGGGGGGGGSSNMNGGSHRTTGSSSANVQEDTDSDEDDLVRAFSLEPFEGKGTAVGNKTRNGLGCDAGASQIAYLMLKKQTRRKSHVCDVYIDIPFAAVLVR